MSRNEEKSKEISVWKQVAERFKDFAVLFVLIFIFLFSQFILAFISKWSQLWVSLRSGLAQKTCGCMSTRRLHENVWLKKNMLRICSCAWNRRCWSGQWQGRPHITSAQSLDSCLSLPERISPEEVKELFIRRAQVWVPNTYCRFSLKKKRYSRYERWITWLPHVWDVHKETSQQERLFFPTVPLENQIIYSPLLVWKAHIRENKGLEKFQQHASPLRHVNK